MHRGIIQNYFRRRGALAAILLSTLIFMISHPPGTYATAFVMGLILGLQYWKMKVLWYPVLTHAAYDGFIPLDTLCLKLAWNPALEQLPAWGPGLVSVLVLVSAAAAIAFLLLRPGRAEPTATQPAATPEPRA